MSLYIHPDFHTIRFCLSKLKTKFKAQRHGDVPVIQNNLKAELDALKFG